MADLERIFDKIDKISEDIYEINISLAKNTISLEEHIRRTNLLEEEIKPVKAHVNLVESIFKIIGFLSIISGIVVAIYEVWK